MLQLVKDGPEIPAELLQALANESLVFFCGAGISQPTGLPMFNKLADYVWDSVQPVAPKTEAEESAYKRGEYDRFLGLLENRLVSGEVRKHVIERLSQPLARAAVYHPDLLKLASLNTGGYRLVTTNFDPRFLEAGCSREHIDSAPKLSPPSRTKWKSLVCIHGLIDRVNDPGGENLVFTTADFGRAYLTEGWASNFLTSLFREYTVVFIGYSIDDPIISYLMTALAGERAVSTQYNTRAYAFGSFDATISGDHDKQHALWKSKGVEPIMYSGLDNHRLLAETIAEWARLKSTGLSYRQEIVEQCMLTHPKGPHDVLSKQVCWALYEDKPTAVKDLAFSTKNIAALDWWLDVFDVVELPLAANQNIKVKLSELPTAQPLVEPVKLIQGIALVSKQSVTASLHEVTYWLGQWLCNYLLQDTDGPRLLEWALSKGDRLHPQWQNMVRRWIDAQDTSTFTPTQVALESAWRVLSSHAVYDGYPPPDLYSYKLQTRKPDGSISETAKLELLAHLKPTLRLSNPWRRAVDHHNAVDVSTFLDGNVELAGGNNTDEVMKHINEDSSRCELLVQCLHELMSLLRATMDMFSMIGKADASGDLSYTELQSIAEHEQDAYAKPWTLLIKLVRDGLDCAYVQNPELAESLLKSLNTFPYPVFQRLVLHAATENDFSGGIALDALLANGADRLWSRFCKRECHRFLRKAGHRLLPDELFKLEQAIAAGPPDSLFRADLRAEQLKLAKDRAVWTRLASLAHSGASLGEAAQTELARINPDGQFKLDPSHEDEFLFIIKDAVWLPDYEAKPTQVLDEITDDEFIARFATAPDTDELRYLASRRPQVVQEILLKEGERTWNVNQWTAVLRGLHEHKYSSPQNEVWQLFKNFVSSMPDTLQKDLYSSIVSWLCDYAPQVKEPDVDQFVDIWLRVWPHVQNCFIGDTLEPVTFAINHPVGQMAQAILLVLRLPKLEKGTGFPEIFKQPFAALVEGSGACQFVAKTILAADLQFLYWLAPDWTDQQLIQSMDWSNGKLADALWSGYLWQFRLSPDLVSALKTSLFGLLLNREEFEKAIDRHFKTQIFVFLSFVLLECKACFNQSDLIKVGTFLGESGLGPFAFELAHRLQRSDKPATMWSDSVKPLLLQLWPADEQTLAEPGRI